MKEGLAQSVGPVSSRVAAEGPVSHPASGAAPAEGLVVNNEDNPVVSPDHTQGVSEHRALPGLGGIEKDVGSQVDVTLLEKPAIDVPLRRGTRIRVQTDRYGS